MDKLPTLPIPDWDEWFFRHVYLASSKSKDTKTKIGAIIIKHRNIISSGFNGIPMGVDDSIPERYERPLKYAVTEHGERNSIYFCARHGISTLGAVLLTNGLPCADCARAIIQSGINEVVVHKQWQEWEQKLYWNKWIESAKHSKEMFDEAGIVITVFDKELGIESMLDGKIITI